MNASFPSVTATQRNALAAGALPGTTSVLLEASSEPELSPRQLKSVIAELVTALSNALNDERESAEECLGRIAAILRPLQRPETNGREQMKGGLAPWQVRKVISYIETNLDKSIRSADLAALLELSACHFSRAFRNSFGDSPLEYVIRRRVERAQGLMLSTDAPLSQIALDCGLADQAHFSRLFRRIVGETPSAWRRARLTPGCAAALPEGDSSMDRTRPPFRQPATLHLSPR